MTKSDLLNDLFKKYGLVFDKDNPNSKDNDVYVHKHYKIITRAGIQKIERAANIQCKFRVVTCGIDNMTLHGFGTNLSNGATYETFASASPSTTQNAYYAEMAEKRARSRLVLTLAGLYEQGVFGEDEADDFSNTVKNASNNTKPLATFKSERS